MKTNRELIIVGGGSAGLSAAQYGARANLDVLVVEEMAPGGQALLIDELENYPGISEPINGYDFSELLRGQAERFGAEFLTTNVVSIRKEGEGFVLETGDGELRSEAVILATGANHRHVGVPGESEFQGRGVSYCATCDGPFFKGKRIVVVGGGDAACDESMYLSKLTDKLLHIHRKDSFRAQKALASRVLNNKGIDVRFGTVTREIRGTKKVESVQLEEISTGRLYEEPADAVFVFVGSEPRSSLAGNAARDESGYLITNERMETSIHGLFAAGDVRVTPFRQIITACSDGAIAAHAASQYIDEVRGKAYA
jgi:thioredoxin reductase (NADPH)